MLQEYIKLLRQNDNYRNLWIGYVISQLGDWFNLIASAALVATLTSTGTALSYLFLARFLPMFLFSPFAGVLSDRFDRRWVMILSDVLRAVTVLCFLLVRSADQLWLFYFLIFIHCCCLFVMIDSLRTKKWTTFHKENTAWGRFDHSPVEPPRSMVAESSPKPSCALPGAKIPFGIHDASERVKRPHKIAQNTERMDVLLFISPSNL